MKITIEVSDPANINQALAALKQLITETADKKTYYAVMVPYNFGGPKTTGDACFTARKTPKGNYIIRE